MDTEGNVPNSLRTPTLPVIPVTIAVSIPHPVFTEGSIEREFYVAEPNRSWPQSRTCNTLAEAVRAWIELGTQRAEITAYQGFADDENADFKRVENCRWIAESGRWSEWKAGA